MYTLVETTTDKTHRSSICPQGEIHGTDELAVNNTGHHAKAIVTQMESHKKCYSIGHSSENPSQRLNIFQQLVADPQ
jgi:hypothetical protein